MLERRYHEWIQSGKNKELCRWPVDENHYVVFPQKVQISITDDKKQRAVKRGGNIDPYNSLIYSLDFYRVGGEASQTQ